MPGQPYGRIESRVTGAIPDWKNWPRRLRRIYASLEDWGSSKEAIIDMVAQWGWEWDGIKKLMAKTDTFTQAVEEYYISGKYPKKKNWTQHVTSSQIKAVYMREGELTSFASLDENPKALSFHQSVVTENGMLDLAEPYGDRDDVMNPENEPLKVPERSSDGSGLSQFDDKD